MVLRALFIWWYLACSIAARISFTPASTADSRSPVAPWRVVNLGNGSPVELGDFIAAIEAATGCVAERNLMEMQPGDVQATWADTTLVTHLVGEIPRTDITEGMRRFVNWYRGYYQP